MKKHQQYCFAIAAVLSLAIPASIPARADWGGFFDGTGQPLPPSAQAANHATQAAPPAAQDGATMASQPSPVPPATEPVILPYVKPGKSANSGPKLVVDSGTSGTIGDPASFDAGLINLNSSAVITHVFSLRNTSSAPITISQIRRSCHCLNVTVSGAGPGGQPSASFIPLSSFIPLTLAPQQQISIRIALDPASTPPGSLEKQVLVYTNRAQIPSTVLTIRADASDGVAISPASLDFGSIAEGAQAVKPVMITLDKSLLPAAGVPQIVASSPSIVVSRPMATATGITCKVSLSPTCPLGSLYGAVSIVDPASPSKTYAAIPVSATVTGPLAASVDMIVFGAVPAGKGGAVSAKLTGPAAAGILTADSDNSNVRVTIENGAAPILHANLLPSAPTGPLNANVTVTTSTGLRLSLPVAADIVGPG